MPLITLRNATISHDHHPLVEGGNLTIERGEKVCIIGRNGAGKSTLLKCLLAQVDLDQGVLEKEVGLTIAMLPQSIPSHVEGTVRELVTSRTPSTTPKHQIDRVLSLLELDGSWVFNELSGGMKRRSLLACALATDPDVLLLDEPTNHLDIEAISWLENFLKKYPKTVIFITHDRVLMENVADHIVEIELGRLISWRGHYHKYLRFKEDLARSEAKAEALFDKKLAEEEAWIRQGIKARRTRNEGRVRALKKMREQRASRRTEQGNVNLAQHDISASGKIVCEVKHLSFRYQDQWLIKDFSTIIQRCDKIGILGPNGSGKTTLINCLLGKLTPTSGSIKQGTKLEVAYFDQTKSNLDESLSVLDNVAGGSTTVTVGKKQKHIISYLQDFLFSPDQVRKPLKHLSGGERNRVMLAKLFLRPCNVLVLDEPTNDLDIETLELLESSLVEFDGTVLLVSHDREFLDNVVTSTLVMEGNGKVGEYVGGYTDWLRQRSTPKNAAEKKQPSQQANQNNENKKEKTKTKLSYNEQRELNLLPEKIEHLEQKLSDLQTQLADPNFYKEHAEEIVVIQQQLQDIDDELQKAYLRWETLESRYD